MGWEGMNRVYRRLHAVETTGGWMRRSLRVLITGMALSLAGLAGLAPQLAGASAGDWGMFHNDTLHSGVSPDTVIGAIHAPAMTAKWAQLVGGGTQGKAAVLSSPVVVFNATLNKTVVYGVSVLGQAHAFNAADGSTIWSVNVGPAVVDTPAVDGNTLYVGTTRGQMVALDATTGAVQCSFQLPIVAPETVPGAIQSSPVVGHVDSTGPVVYFGDIGQSEKVNAGHEWAINGFGNSAGNCTQRWVWNNFVNKGITGTKSGSWSPPALGTDSTGRPLLVFGSSNPDDSVYALDARDASFVWRFHTLQTGGDQDVGAGPTISAPGVNGFTNGVVYVDGKDKIEVAIDMLTGQQIWAFNMQTDSGLTANSVSCAALTGNLVVVAYAGYVYAFNAQTGAKIWRTAIATGTILASVSVSGAAGDQVVMIGDLGGGEHAYRLSDGALLFSMNIGHKIHASTAVSAGMAFFASDGGSVYALG
jgi:outer membrane protein assembly factor BamB